MITYFLRSIQTYNNIIYKKGKVYLKFVSKLSGEGLNIHIKKFSWQPPLKSAIFDIISGNCKHYYIFAGKL